MSDAAAEIAILAFDPGGTTGWAVLRLSQACLTEPDVRILASIRAWECGQYTGPEFAHVDQAEGLLDQWPAGAVVVEDFILRTANRNRDVLSPVRIGFGLGYLCWKRGKSPYLQQPAMAKTTASDDRLKAWGLYRPGEEHARDATRHAITFARRCKDQPGLLAKVLG